MSFFLSKSFKWQMLFTPKELDVHAPGQTTAARLQKLRRVVEDSKRRPPYSAAIRLCDGTRVIFHEIHSGWLDNAASSVTLSRDAASAFSVVIDRLEEIEPRLRPQETKHVALMKKNVAARRKILSLLEDEKIDRDDKRDKIKAILSQLRSSHEPSSENGAGR